MELPIRNIKNFLLVSLLANLADQKYKKIVSIIVGKFG